MKEAFMRIKNISKVAIGIRGFGTVEPQEEMEISDSRGTELLRCIGIWEEVKPKARAKKKIKIDTTAKDNLEINTNTED
jgi:hypothetical protein